MQNQLSAFNLPHCIDLIMKAEKNRGSDSFYPTNGTFGEATKGLPSERA